MDNYKPLKLIKIEVPEELTSLAGYDYGRLLSTKQVLSELECDNDEKVVVVFPDKISRAATSFVGGFISGVSSKVKGEDFSRRIVVEGSESLKSCFFYFCTNYFG